MKSVTQGLLNECQTLSWPRRLSTGRPLPAALPNTLPHGQNVETGDPAHTLGCLPWSLCLCLLPTEGLSLILSLKPEPCWGPVQSQHFPHRFPKLYDLCSSEDLETLVCPHPVPLSVTHSTRPRLILLSLSRSNTVLPIKVSEYVK